MQPAVCCSSYAFGLLNNKMDDFSLMVFLYIRGSTVTFNLPIFHTKYINYANHMRDKKLLHFNVNHNCLISCVSGNSNLKKRVDLVNSVCAFNGCSHNTGL